MNLNLTMFAQAVAFILFILFTVRFVWPPMLRAIESRQKQIADGLAAGERGRQDLELASKRASEVLQQARTQASEVLAQAEKRGLAMIEEAKAAARSEGEKIIAGAKAEIAQEAFRAKEALRSQVAVLALAGAEKILRREVDAKAHAQLLSGLESELR